ncbi:MAG: gliding motility-associated C-terminal domain-containing protein, partial [Bacteroidota bacterium]
TATDPDLGDKLKLSAIGSPFILEYSPADNPGNWHPDSVDYQTQPVTKTFRCQTTCEHISDLEYNVVFKAVDDFFLQTIPNSSGLATSKNVRIKVVGPPPADVKAKPSSQRIEISWLKPYQCEAAADEYFFGFSVWRREGSNPFPVECDDPGLDGKGYVKIANTKAEVNGRYQYTDNDVERGRTYCYRILARFAKRTDSGQPYNFVESLPSEEICVQLSRDVPLITNVSVLETSPNNGRIEVKWMKPLADDLDTLLNHGPYRYEVQWARGFGGTNFETLATFTSPTYWQLTQSEFIHQTGLNTQGEAHTYRIAFFVKNEQNPLGYSPTASSVFLEIAPTDNRNNLSWKAEVPWVNTKYTIFRKHDLAPQWDSLATVQDTFYADKGLINGREYCYYVKTYGSYGIAGLPSPLVNLSQETCAIPV